MEDNNNSDAKNMIPTVAPDCAESVENPAPCEQSEIKAPEPEKVPVKKQFHKNGRNRGAAKSSTPKPGISESCGEVSDLASFKEKLSGESPKGYADKQPRDRSEKRQHRDNEIEEPQNDNLDTPEKEHSGPSFETESFTPRAVEVPLTDKRMGTKRDKSDDGVVSYNSNIAEECPPLSLFARIKNAVRSLFSGKDKKGGKKRKHGGKGDWKNNRQGDFKRRQSGNQYKNGDRKYQKNFRNRKRPYGGGGKGRNSRPQE